MDYNKAKELYHRQWITGKHKGQEDLYEFPYNFLYENDEFIETEVDPEDCLTQEVDEKRVNIYKSLLSNGNDLGPSWLIFGKRLKGGTISKIHGHKYFVLDGNHRLEARKRIGFRKVPVIVPKSCHNHFESEKQWQE